LVRRYNQLGRLLPSVDDFEASDPEARAEADVVIEEMHKTKAAMDQLLIDERKRREGGRRTLALTKVLKTGLVMNRAWTAIGIATLVRILATAPVAACALDQTMRLWGKLHGDVNP